jgi:sialic acid synthase SpsE
MKKPYNIERRLFRIGGRSIGEGRPVFIIAEAGVNHNGDIKTAKLLIDAAKVAGADAVKFQVFQTDKFVSKDTPAVAYQQKRGFKNQYDMLKGVELSYDDFRELARYAKKKDIIFLITPHSCREDVDLVAELCPAIKIGSGALTNYSLINHIAKKKLPVILSTGMADISDIIKACLYLFKNHVVLMQCTTEYPCPVGHANLNAIKMLKASGVAVGFSDHTESLVVPAAAVAMGACVIEKHFTLDKNMKGPDHAFSLTPGEFKIMVKNIHDVEQALGSHEKKPTKAELEIREVIRKRGMRK